jgi:hypothetical protein
MAGIHELFKRPYWKVMKESNDAISPLGELEATPMSFVGRRNDDRPRSKYFHWITAIIRLAGVNDEIVMATLDTVQTGNLVVPYRLRIHSRSGSANS